MHLSCLASLGSIRSEVASELPTIFMSGIPFRDVLLVICMYIPLLFFLMELGCLLVVFPNRVCCLGI